MGRETFSPALTAMIDRANTLPAAQVESLGNLWNTGEGLILPSTSFALAALGEVDYPVVTNQELVDAWQRALDAAGEAGRANELDAAIAGGRAVNDDVRHLAVSAAAKNGAEQAVRSAMLALAVRDLIANTDYETLIGAWLHVTGAS